MLTKGTGKLYEIIQTCGIDYSEIAYLKILNFDYPILCPGCNREMKVKDSKRRYIKDSSGRKIPFNFRRFYCTNCDRLHVELPDLVAPYSQYDTATKEHVRRGNDYLFGGDDSTIRKWRKK